jgi:pyruvate/oxaloacetate carboxyltransferase
LKPGLDQARKDSAGMARSDEDVLTYALFPDIAKDFFQWREQGSATRQAATGISKGGERPIA